MANVMPSMMGTSVCACHREWLQAVSSGRKVVHVASAIVITNSKSHSSSKLFYHQQILFHPYHKLLKL